MLAILETRCGCRRITPARDGTMYLRVPLAKPPETRCLTEQEYQHVLDKGFTEETRLFERRRWERIDGVVYFIFVEVPNGR